MMIDVCCMAIVVSGIACTLNNNRHRLVLHISQKIISTGNTTAI